jgi:hypothetical protein
MNLVELDRALRKLRLSGMADVLETRLRHAQTERLHRSIWSPRSSPTSYNDAKTDSWPDATSLPASATATARSTASISIPTRR